MNQTGLMLAFGFGSPWLLTGLVLAGIPILIHLLHRRRYRETPWAAMRFLIEATRKQSRRIRLEHLILLLLRTMIVALLVLALARPHLESSSGVLRGSAPLHRILVIDATFSMQFSEGEPELHADGPPGANTGTRFARAKQMAREMVQQAQRGDCWNLVRIADREPFAVIGQPAFVAETVLDELQNLQPTDAAGNLLQTLESVLELTEQVSEMPQKEVVFVTDLQSALWAPDHPATRTRLRALMQKIEDRSRLTIIHVGGSDTLNAAVTGISTDTVAATVGRPVQLSSVLRNFGTATLRNQVVELSADDRLVDTKRVDLPVGVDVTVDWSHTFHAAGDHKLEVHLQADSLAIDNRRWLVCPVRDELRVLLVDGRSTGRGRESASFYVARALSPVSWGETTAGSIRPQVIAESELPGTNLSLYDVVALCDVGLITEREASLLESYVRSGRGLIIFPGEQTSADSYNLRLSRDQQGVLPAKLGERVVVEDREKLLSFDARGFTHPLVQAFQGNPGTGLESTLTFQYLRLDPLPGTSIALWFSDGSPALVEKSVGTGRVVLSATSVDDRWGTWAIWAPSFVPMMHEIVLFAVGGTGRERQLKIGQPVLAMFPARAFDVEATVRRPDGATAVARTTDRDDATLATFEATDRAGIYTVEVGPPLNAIELFAVNVDTAESDLRQVNAQELSGRVFSDVDVTIRSSSDPLPVSIGTEIQSAISILTRLMATAVLICLLLEPLMAWRFGWGVIGLAAFVLLAGLSWFTGWWLAFAALVVSSVALFWWQGKRGLPV